MASNLSLAWNLMLTTDNCTNLYNIEQNIIRDSWLLITAYLLSKGNILKSAKFIGKFYGKKKISFVIIIQQEERWKPFGKIGIFSLPTSLT